MGAVTVAAVGLCVWAWRRPRRRNGRFVYVGAAILEGASAVVDKTGASTVVVASLAGVGAITAVAGAAV